MNNKFPDHIGESSRIVDGGAYDVKDEVCELHGDSKLIYIQQMQFSDDGRLEYRFAYWKKGKGGNWIFARSAPFIPPAQLTILLGKARAKGWEGFT